MVHVELGQPLDIAALPALCLIVHLEIAHDAHLALALLIVLERLPPKAKDHHHGLAHGVKHGEGAVGRHVFRVVARLLELAVNVREEVARDLARLRVVDIVRAADHGRDVGRRGDAGDDGGCPLEEGFADE